MEENFFAILKLDQQFNLTEDQVENAYITQQAKNIGNEEILSIINQAYKTLSDPLSRAIHLLKLSTYFEENVTMDKQYMLKMIDIMDEGNLDKIHSIINDLYLQLSDAFQKQNIKHAAELVVKIKSFNRLLENIKNETIL